MKSVRVSVSVQKVMGLGTVSVEKRDVRSTMSVHGRYELLPDARESVATPVAGLLRFEVKPLAKVAKGDVLFTVTSPDLVARSREIALLEKRLSVYHGINTKNAALENELAVKKAARSALIAHAEEKDGVVTLRATRDALVETFSARNGDWLDAGESALVTVRRKALHLKALVSAGDASRLSDRLKAKVGSFDGEVRLGVGDDSGIVPVYILFDGDVDAQAGERAEAVISVSGGGDARTAVPSKCIVDIDLQPTVFVRDSGDPALFVAVPVTPVESSGGWTAVDGSLPVGAEVVSDGAYELKLALSSGDGGSAGHFHADGTFHEGDH